MHQRQPYLVRNKSFEATKTPTLKKINEKVIVNMHPEGLHQQIYKSESCIKVTKYWYMLTIYCIGPSELHPSLLAWEMWDASRQILYLYYDERRDIRCNIA